MTNMEKHNGYVNVTVENKKIINGASLRRGLTTSCGCRVRETMQAYNDSRVIDETGNVYGYLVVVSRNTEEQYQTDGRAMWNCLCRCGKMCVVSGKHLRRGETTSCGCRIQSKGEEKIENLLSKNNITYVTQYPIDARNNSDDRKMRCDFAVLDNNNKLLYVIEYDGIQHFQHKDSGWNTEENFKLTQERDSLKNEWCKNNNIPIIRIPYTHLNELCIEDLLLATSPFLLKWSE